MKYHLQDMTCGGCVRSVTRAIQTLDPQAKIDADLQTKQVEITSTIEDARIREALQAAGFPVSSGPTQ